MSNDAPDAPAAVTPEAIYDLRRRLDGYRPARVAAAPGWSRGVPLDYLGVLVEYWRTHYDWTVHEDRIRRLPWVIAGGEHKLRLVHQRVGAEAPTLVLLHGWPDSILRFDRILPELADVNLVIPALPGFPFALPLPDGGLGSVAMATLVGEALEDLGYPRYTLSAGDIGCDVAEALAAQRRAEVASLHVTDISQIHYLVNPPTDLSETELAYTRHGTDWQRREGGYMHEQATKPQTIAVPLSDSPVGLAAWILEKLHGWTDCGNDVESVFSRDELLTWISAYWFDGCIGTSFEPYTVGADMNWAPITAPTAATIFPKDLVNAPREFAERYFDIRWWREFDHGGHFAAFEHPADYLTGVRAALELAEQNQ
ncbi:epoxide hydrolase family protein [Amycolatopsis jiangsuensis]|uniref:Pimeloyl-ACP methyl ester carboxylesterase n=1 Tax=Amycolatopsis jiangsuensis TaxID=1181879 RepID=A0A840J2V9_9PSEU|nr:epoxide hydrolase family protein [Amycolatopsis jiangsuensis]MBB4688213.1 pimeloyl-ACP methyl ester carboxylesterase [Amycolatopsis jiangsuensis]